jgi:hypothetical protein
MFVQASTLAASKIPNFKAFLLSRRRLETYSMYEQLLLDLIKQGKTEKIQVISGILDAEVVKTYLSASNVMFCPLK